MSFIIGTGPDGAWQRVEVNYDATAVPIPVAGVSIWIPPALGLVRAFVCSGDSVSPLVGNGGATTLSIGQTSGPNLLVNAASIASVNGGVICWGGASGPRVSDANNGVADSGVVVCPAGAFPGNAAALRHITALTNAGTITGRLRFVLEFRPLAA